MRDRRVHAIGQVVLSKKEQLVLIRPLDNLFSMTVLRYPSQVRLPSCLGEEIDAPPQFGKEERSLAQALVEAYTRPQFEPDRYTDPYAVKLQQLIDAKVNGEELASAPQSEPRQVLSLMEALKASVAQSGTSAAAGDARGVLAEQLSRRGKRSATGGKKRAKASGRGRPQKKSA
jgi:DNA end-binding protein Ku